MIARDWGIDPRQPAAREGLPACTCRCYRGARRALQQARMARSPPSGDRSSESHPMPTLRRKVMGDPATSFVESPVAAQARLVACERGEHGLLNLRLRACDVPEAHFIDAALEEVCGAAGADGPRRTASCRSEL